MSNSSSTYKHQTDFYAENPGKVASLRITDGDGTLVGRALVWTDDDGNRMMDRVYPSDGGAHIRTAIEYAHKQGWVAKERQTYDCPFEDGLPHTTTCKDVDRYPFMDTMFYAKPDYGNIILSATLPARPFYTMQSVDGDCPWEDRETEETRVCYGCSVEFYEEDMVQVRVDGGHEWVCQSCRNDDYVYSDTLDEYIRAIDSVQSDRGNGPIPICDAVYSVILGDYLFGAQCILITAGPSAAMSVDGDEYASQRDIPDEVPIGQYVPMFHNGRYSHVVDSDGGIWLRREYEARDSHSTAPITDTITLTSFDGEGINSPEGDS